MVDKADIGLIGLAAMGRNLALNLERHGYGVAVYNRTWERTEEFAASARGKNILPVKSLVEMAVSLKQPRRVLLLVHPDAVEDLLRELAAVLAPGDVIIDGGNSNYLASIRRGEELAQKGLRFLDAGVAGGPEEALNGPGIMAGGTRDTWLAAGKPLMDIAARVDGESCCALVGPQGAGHFVKTVHNGVEYALMQLIAEAYHLMRALLGLPAMDIQPVFRHWNAGPLASYLIEITGDILGNADETTGKPLLDLILDEAGQKGTGRWAVQSALECGVPAPTIAEAVFARALSARKHERTMASSQFSPVVEEPELNKYAFIDGVGEALYSSMICSLAQGFSLLRTVSDERGWGMGMKGVITLWRGGTIRSDLLKLTGDTFAENPLLKNLMLAPAMREALEGAQSSWRGVVSTAARAGIPVPCMASALMYFDACRSAWLPANLIEAQRDYFGAHGYRRTDMPGEFHTEWKKE